MSQRDLFTLGIDIGSTTVKIAVLDEKNELLFSDYERHFANIQETLSDLLGRAVHQLGAIHASPVITGSGGLTLAKFRLSRKLSPYPRLYRIMHRRPMLPSSSEARTRRLSILKMETWSKE